MPSTVISATKDQLTLNFEPGIAERYGSLRECVATGVYQRGLKRVAIDLDQAPSNLSVQLSEDSSRNFSVDSLERYIEKTGDTAPVMYLIERFLAKDAQSDGSKKLAAMRLKMAEMMREMEGLSQ